MSEGWRRLILFVRGVAVVWAAGIILACIANDSFSEGAGLSMVLLGVAIVPALILWALAWLIEGFASRL